MIPVKERGNWICVIQRKYVLAEIRWHTSGKQLILSFERDGAEYWISIAKTKPSEDIERLERKKTEAKEAEKKKSLW